LTTTCDSPTQLVALFFSMLVACRKEEEKGTEKSDL
jgi:hypothetical protein